MEFHICKIGRWDLNENYDLLSVVKDRILPFGSTYLCEISFFGGVATTAIRTKY